MKVGVVPPVPTEVFTRSGHLAVNLWSSFYECEDRSSLEREIPFPFREDVPSPWAGGLYALALRERLEGLVLPRPCPFGILEPVAKALEREGIRVFRFQYPLLRNLSRLREEIGRLCEAFGIPPERLNEGVQDWSGLRLSLKRLDGIQVRNAAFPSLGYLRALAAAMNPGGDLDAARRDTEARILEYDSLGQERWTRLGVVGVTPYRPEFFALLEKLRAVIVYDELGLDANPMGASQELSALYHNCSLPYGLKRRGSRLEKEIRERRIHGLLLGVEAISGGRRDEGFFRSTMPVPLFAVETCRSGEMSGSETRLLQHFLSRCAARNP